LSGPTLVNTSNVVLKATVMPQWQKLFEAEDSDLGGDPKPSEEDHEQSR
jgi:hypothetical protein